VAIIKNYNLYIVRANNVLVKLIKSVAWLVLLAG